MNVEGGQGLANVSMNLLHPGRSVIRRGGRSTLSYAFQLAQSLSDL